MISLEINSSLKWYRNLEHISDVKWRKISYKFDMKYLHYLIKTDALIASNQFTYSFQVVNKLFARFPLWTRTPQNLYSVRSFGRQCCGDTDRPLQRTRTSSAGGGNWRGQANLELIGYGQSDTIHMLCDPYITESICMAAQHACPHLD